MPDRRHHRLYTVTRHRAREDTMWRDVTELYAVLQVAVLRDVYVGTTKRYAERVPSPRRAEQSERLTNHGLKMEFGKQV